MAPVVVGGIGRDRPRNGARYRWRSTKAADAFRRAGAGDGADGVATRDVRPCYFARDPVFHEDRELPRVRAISRSELVTQDVCVEFACSDSFVQRVDFKAQTKGQ